MLSKPILEEKDQVQHQLDDQVGHDLQAYLANLHQIVLATEKTYGLTFRYEALQMTPDAKPKIGGIRASKHRKHQRKMRIA